MKTEVNLAKGQVCVLTAAGYGIKCIVTHGDIGVAVEVYDKDDRIISQYLHVNRVYDKDDKIISQHLRLHKEG